MGPKSIQDTRIVRNEMQYLSTIPIKGTQQRTGFSVWRLTELCWRRQPTRNTTYGSLVPLISIEASLLAPQQFDDNRSHVSDIVGERCFVDILNRTPASSKRVPKQLQLC